MARTWKEVKIGEIFKAGDLTATKINDLEYVDLANTIMGSQNMTPLVEANIDLTPEDLVGGTYITDPQTRVQRRVPAVAGAKKVEPVPTTPTARIIPPDLGLPVSKPVAAKPAAAPVKKGAPVSKAAAINEVKKSLAGEKAILRVTMANIAKYERQLAKLQAKK